MCGLTRLQTSTWSASKASAVEVDRKAFRRAADDDGFHARADRAADELLGDAVGFDELPLSFGGSAAVAAHGRHDERLRAEGR